MGALTWSFLLLVSGVRLGRARARSFGRLPRNTTGCGQSRPDAAIDWLLPLRCAIAADLAAGTGRLFRPFARRVEHVVAIEPDRRMAAVLRDRSPGVAVDSGVGKMLPLADASVDAVLVSSAWHSLDPERAIPELGRVLGDGGRPGEASSDSVRTLAADDFVGMLAIYSAMFTASEKGRKAELATARAGLDRLFPGATEVEVPMRAPCWRAGRVPRG